MDPHTEVVPQTPHGSRTNRVAAIRHILFPFDFSPQGVEIAPFVRAFAIQFGAQVTLFSVVPPGLPPSGMRPLIEDNPPERTQAVRDRLDDALVEELREVRVDRIADGGDAALRIAAFASANRVDLIMMPTHGLGVFRRFLVGSVTSKVLHDARCPVWTAAHAETQRSPHVPRTVVCAVDAAPESARLLQWADQFCRAVAAQLRVLHVVRPITDWPSLERERELQDQIREEARKNLANIEKEAGVAAPLCVPVGEIVSTVVEEARQAEADLIVIGRGSLSESFGGLRTHAFGIVQRSRCPVLSV